MRLSTVFSESFLDGFTLAGFVTKLRRPGAASQMFEAKPVDGDWQSVTFEFAASAGEVEVSADLQAVSEPVLRTMMTLLKREDEVRKQSREASQKAGYGTSR